MTDAVSFDNDPKNGYNQSQSNGEYWFEELCPKRPSIAAKIH